MGRLIFARALEADDGDALEAIDQSYALHFDLEPALTRSSLSFYARSGHAFVSMREGKANGFVLAQAVWNGTRPVVMVNRLAVENLGDTDSREALLEAVTKSAYDAAVYDIQVVIETRDKGAQQALLGKDYAPKPLIMYERILGSRGAKGG